MPCVQCALVCQGIALIIERVEALYEKQMPSFQSADAQINIKLLASHLSLLWYFPIFGHQLWHGKTV